MSAQPSAIGKVPTSGKILAWLSVLLGILTALAPLYPGVPPEGPSPGFLEAYFVLLGLTCAISGVDALRGSSRGFYVLWYVYAVQMFAYRSESHYVNFMGPYSVAFVMGENDPPSALRVNVLAIVGCLIALYSARFLARSRIVASVTDV